MGVRLFYRDKPLFGMEISQSGLRVMALDKKRRVLGYGSIQLEAAKLDESINKATDFLTENIRSLIETKIVGKLPNSRRVALSAPTAKTFTRTITLPLSAEDNLLDAVQLEAEQYIPVPLSELYVDYSIVYRGKEGLDVLMCAVPKRIVDALVSSCQKSGLEPVLVEPAIISLSRLINDSEQGYLPTLIVDIGSASADIAVLDGQTVRVTGGAPVGGDMMTNAIAEGLNLDKEEAYYLKVHSGLGISSDQAKMKQVLTPLLDQIATEIRKVIRYYTERIGASSKLQQVVIVGSGSNLPGLGDYFTEALVMPARIGSPWQSVHFGKLRQPPADLRARYAKVIGLAMSRPEEIWK